MRPFNTATRESLLLSSMHWPSHLGVAVHLLLCYVRIAKGQSFVSLIADGSCRTIPLILVYDLAIG